MLDFFAQFGNIIVSLMTFVIHTVQSLVFLFTRIPTYTAFLINSINVLPVVILPFVTASISIYVVLFVLGRN